MNKRQYLSRDLWFLKWKALGASLHLYWDWDFGCLRKTSGFFGRLSTSSGIFGNDCVVFKNLSPPRIKISRLYLRKSWQVYHISMMFVPIQVLQSCFMCLVVCLYNTKGKCRARTSHTGASSWWSLYGVEAFFKVVINTHTGISKWWLTTYLGTCTCTRFHMFTQLIVLCRVAPKES